MKSLISRLSLLVGPLLLLVPPSIDATIDTVAGNGAEMDGGDAGTAREIGIWGPFGVEMGPDQQLYVTEIGSHRIRRIDLGSGRAISVVGCGRKGYSGDGGAAEKAELNEPYELRFDQKGHMYFVEMQNHIVRRVDAESRIITTVAGTGRPGFSGDGGPATEAMMRSPHSIALDQRGMLYIADIGNHRIRRVDLSSGAISTIAGDGQRKLPIDGGKVRGKPILGPRALFVADRTMWIALREGHSVWRMDLDQGTIHHVAGRGTKGFSGDGGHPKHAQFNGPKGIAVGTKGIYVVDTENQTIRLIHKDLQKIETIAGVGPEARGYRGDRGAATEAHLDRPHGICVSNREDIYIGDSNNHRVRRIRWKD